MMKSENLMIIDPSLEIPEIESYNEISLCSPLKTTYHLPEIHSPKTMTSILLTQKVLFLWAVQHLYMTPIRGCRA